MFETRDPMEVRVQLQALARFSTEGLQVPYIPQRQKLQARSTAHHLQSIMDGNDPAHRDTQIRAIGTRILWNLKPSSSPSSYYCSSGPERVVRAPILRAPSLRTCITPPLHHQ